MRFVCEKEHGYSKANSDGAISAVRTFCKHLPLISDEENEHGKFGKARWDFLTRWCLTWRHNAGLRNLGSIMIRVPTSDHQGSSLVRSWLLPPAGNLANWVSEQTFFFFFGELVWSVDPRGSRCPQPDAESRKRKTKESAFRRLLMWRSRGHFRSLRTGSACLRVGPALMVGFCPSLKVEMSEWPRLYKVLVRSTLIRTDHKCC